MKIPSIPHFQKIVSNKTIAEIGQQVKFTKRSTAKISANIFLHLLMSQIHSGKGMDLTSLNICLQKVNPRIDVSNQALARYMYRESSVEFIKTVFKKNSNL